MRQIIYCCFVVFFLSCSGNKKIESNFLSGTFKEPDYEQELVFNNNGFVYKSPAREHLPPYSCCDTVTYGTWKLDGSLIRLSTNAIASSYFELQGNEDITASDSFCIDIRPIIRRLTVNPVNRKSEFNFVILIYDKTGRNSASMKGNMADSFFYLGGSQSEIKKISLRIFPSDNYLGRARGITDISSHDYVVENSKSKYLVLDIPKLTYSYFTYIRLDNDFVKIINKNTLEWHGKTYKKRT